MEDLWRLTQEPSQHARWDMRFSDIAYLPREGGEAQRFRYTRSVLPGVVVEGWGETRGERREEEDSAASALAFGSGQRRSLIERGSGYWRYEREGDTIRFLTRYDYETRWGAPGRLLDRLALRPLIGWATAWSFDRLRMWVEEDVAPERSRRSATIHAVATGALASAWLYQGLVPKLLVRDEGELRLLRRSGFLPGHEERLLSAVGAAEVAFAGALLARSHQRWPFLANLAVLPALAAGALRSDRAVFLQPFNPASLTFAMMGLAAAALLAQKDRPSAARCLREPSD